MSNLTDIAISPKDYFLQIFKKDEFAWNGLKDHPLNLLRKKAAEKFEQMDFPTRRDENWKYTSVSNILTVQFGEASKKTAKKPLSENIRIPGLDAHYLVFINGIFDEELSDSGFSQPGLHIVRIGDYPNDSEHKDLILNILETSLEHVENAFGALNLAFAKNGILIKADKNVQIEKPVCLLHIDTDENAPSVFFPQIFVKAETGSRLSVIEHFSSIGETSKNFSNALAQFFVEKNARLDHYKIQNLHTSASQISNGHVWQKRDSFFNSFVVDLGGKIVRNNLSAILTDTNTETHLYGAYLPAADQHIDNQTFIDHAFPNCFSNELYKGVIGAGGRGVFNGKVMVRPDAQKTNAFQQNANLLLDDSAIMDSKPQLEIFADDVKCSHGATIGQLDEASVFYLRSRGINDADARALLQYAFLGEVIENFQIQPLKSAVEQLILNKLNQ